VAGACSRPLCFFSDFLSGTILPIYPGLGQAPNMLACISGGLVIFNRRVMLFSFCEINTDDDHYDIIFTDVVTLDTVNKANSSLNSCC